MQTESSKPHLYLRIKRWHNSYRICILQSPCSPEIAQPTDIFELNNSVYTDVNGLAELSISVVGKPGFPRKCGLDGQVKISFRQYKLYYILYSRVIIHCIPGVAKLRLFEPLIAAL